MDEAAAATLFPEGGALGATVEIRGEPFTVAGLIRKSDSFQAGDPVFSGLPHLSSDGVRHHSHAGRLLAVIFSYDEPQNALLRTDTPEAMSQAGKDAAEIMNRSVTVSGKDIQYQGEDLLKEPEICRN